MSRRSDAGAVCAVRVPLWRSVLRSSAARLRCPVCVDGPVLDRVHVFLHVRPRFVVQFVPTSRVVHAVGTLGGVHTVGIIDLWSKNILV
jgi:hypothetical protein